MDKSETPHLLSVEDNAETRCVLDHLLDGDYKLTFVSDAEGALAAIDSGKTFDALLVDINLGPGKTGTELLHHIDAHDDIGELPSIAVTAYAMPGDREDLLDEGFDGYVGKPFTGEELTETIEQALATG